MDNHIARRSKNAKASGDASEIFAAYDVVSQWDDDPTGNPFGGESRHALVRFFCVDSDGRQLGPDSSARIFDGPSFFVWLLSRNRNATRLGRIVRWAEA
jgi:hypothetical protein